MQQTHVHCRKKTYKFDVVTIEGVLWICKAPKSLQTAAQQSCIRLSGKPTAQYRRLPEAEYDDLT